MNNLKRLHVLVVLTMLVALVLPAITYAGVIEGDRHSSSDPEIEFTGEITEVGADYVKVDGQTVDIRSGTEVEGSLNEGDVVKVHASYDSQGNLVAREIEPADDDDAFDDNSNARDGMDNTNGDDMSNSNDDDLVDNGNANDDNDSNSNDDDSNSNDDDSNSNDDDDSNSNDDDDSNSNDDDDSNSNDDDDSNSNDDDDSNDNDDDHGNDNDDDHGNDNDDDDHGNDNDDDDNDNGDDD